ncbi:hypothetical protein FBU30_000914 [Linnemannia zychae]|nr:hypothetical protein FBU30_000914 [Linnemannia zychae]
MMYANLPFIIKLHSCIGAKLVHSPGFKVQKFYFPPIPNNSRVATQDDEILGYHIPKGTEIWISPAALHVHKGVFGEDADEFKPERWMDPLKLTEEQRRTTKTVTSDMLWAYMPFMIGPHNCIGSKLALIEIRVLLYCLLIDFEYFPSPGFKFRKESRIACRPKPGMKLSADEIVSGSEPYATTI